MILDALLHAMDLAAVHDWDESKAILESMDDPIAGRFFMFVCALERDAQLRDRHAATIRHEVGNALTIAQANVEGIVDGVLQATPERLNGVLAALSSANSMIDGLKHLPEADPLGDVVRIETFNICALVAAHAAAIAGLAESKNVRVLYDPCSNSHCSCMHFRGDSARVGQILQNILINAVRYTPPGGSVGIRCEKPGSDLTIVITDSGAGIASEDAPHLFEPGYRGKNAQGQGSGIGLGVVEKILKSLGGNVRVTDADGTGAVFTVTLPTIPLAPRSERIPV
ncbi:MAG: sensor histidine kinase [Vulcanimicrobiaceae bacterium]